MRSVCSISATALDGLAAQGDLLLYRDEAFQDRLIARGGRSIYAHAGMLARRGDRWVVLEMMQFAGGRWRYLDDAVRDDPGCWDLYAANSGNRWQQWDRRRAVAEMWRLTARPYGWRHVLWAALLHLPLIRCLIPVATDDDSADRHAPFCSEAVAIAARLAGVDVVPMLPDALTEPGDLARSLFFDYTLTLAKEPPCAH